MARLMVTGLKLPESCHECKLAEWQYCWVKCRINDKLREDPGDTRPKSCPLKEMPKPKKVTKAIPKQYIDQLNDVWNKLYSDTSTSAVNNKDMKLAKKLSGYQKKFEKAIAHFNKKGDTSNEDTD